MASEEIFLDKVDPDGKQITVTSARIAIGTATYATVNITSVDIKQILPDFRAAIGAGVAGAFALILGIVIAKTTLGAGAVFIILGVLVILIAFFLASNTKTQFALVFQTAGAEQKALISTSKSDIEEIKGAVNEAIIATQQGQVYASLQPVQPTPPAQPAQPDVIQQIQRLAELHQSGIISTAEFEAKKTDLLNRL